MVKDVFSEDEALATEKSARAAELERNGKEA